MIERFANGRILDLDFGFCAERPARSGQDKPFYLGIFLAAKALVKSVVFRIDREQFGSVAFGGGGHQFARHHERFLIGERDAFAGFDRTQSRQKPDRSDRGGNDRFDARFGRDGNEAFVAEFDPWFTDAEHAKFTAEFFGTGFVTARRYFWRMPRDLLGKKLHISAGRERNNTEIFEMIDDF
jgi:hypothetical protein